MGPDGQCDPELVLQLVREAIELVFEEQSREADRPVLFGIWIECIQLAFFGPQLNQLNS